MALNISTGLKRQLMHRASFADALNGGCILVFSGTQPDTADDAVPGGSVLTGRITANGGAWTAGLPANGLRYELVGNYAIREYGQQWRLKGLTNGPAAWFRAVGNAYDAGAGSVELCRIDGACYPLADPHAGLILPSLNLTTSYDRVIEGFQFTL